MDGLGEVAVYPSTANGMGEKEATLANEQYVERDYVEGLIAQNSVKAHLVAFVA